MDDGIRVSALELSRRVRQIVGARLLSRGFTLRDEGSVYARRRFPLAVDVVTLPVDLQDNDSPIFVTANVSIECPPLAPLVEQLSRGAYVPSAARITRNVGDLLGHKRRWRRWQFSSTNNLQRRAEELADAVEMHGIAWLESIVDSETLIASFEQYGPRQGASVRLAALRSLLAESADEAVELPGARERTPARQTA